MSTLLFRVAVLMAGLVFALPGLAACRYTPGAFFETLSPNLSELVVDPSVPDRTQIGPEYEVWAANYTYMNCDASPAYTQNFDMLLPGPIPGSAGLYATSYPGIAVAVAHVYNSVWNWYPYSRTDAWAGSWTIEPHHWNAAYRVRFFKYGKVQYGGGTIAPATIARYTTNWSGGSLPISQINLPGIVVRTPACVVSNINVDMGSHTTMAKTWGGIGSRSADVPFNLTVRGCKAGFSGIAFTLTPITPLVAAPDWNLSLDSSSTASGVGIQIRRADNDSIVPICEDWCRNVSLYDSNTGGDATLALKANYIQTAAVIQPGTANSSIWFTVTHP